MDKTGGGSYLHLTLFQYFDNCHANIGVFCTDFNNADVLYMGRPASELDVRALTKVALTFKAAKNHSDQCISLNPMDLTVPSICSMSVLTPASPCIRDDPEPLRAGGVVPPAQP